MKEKIKKNKERGIITMEKQRLRKNKGITLIALVITIIVLLILAGVSIAMLTGENGILTQAQKAKTETEQAAENEAAILSDYETKINEELGIKPEAEPGHYYETNTEVQIGGKELTIPGGASLSKIEGEYEDVEQGIVIYITNKQITDEEWQDVETMQKTYDQFVWVPVTGDYKRNTTYADTNVSAAAYTDKDYLPDGIQPTIPDELSIPEGKTEDEVIGEINENAEREAIVGEGKAGGFYISRYEAGKETTTNKLISRKGATVWNSIPQARCKTEAKKYTEEYNTSLNENVKSALCSGIQWDMTMVFVNGKQDGSSDADKTYNVTQSKASRHIGSKAPSGQNVADRVCNIFDLEGNYYEYVAEKNSSNIFPPFVYRGGGYNDSHSASSRYGNDGLAYGNDSFRFTLYVM